MEYKFVFDDRDNNLLNEKGDPVVDDIEMSDCLPLDTLTNLTKYREIEREREREVDIMSKEKREKIPKNEDEPGYLIRRYLIYSLQDREAFFPDWIEKPGTSISSIAKSLGILSRTAQKWVSEYKEADDGELPLPKIKGNPKPRLNDEHKDYLKDIVDDNPSSTLVDMLDALCTSFDGLNVSKYSLNRFLKDECAFSFKLARKESVDRNSEAKIEQRFQYVTQLMDSDVDYLSNCIFIDEAAFNNNMKRSGGWAPKGETPVGCQNTIYKS